MNTRLSGFLLPSMLAVAVATPAAAFTMHFQGTALEGSYGYVFPYESEETQYADFTGQPVDIELSISGSPWGLYVDSFNLTWSGQAYDYPFVTNFGGGGFAPDPDAYPPPGFLSQVTLTPTGGSIRIDADAAWLSETDGDFGLHFNFTLSSPHPVGSAFTDSALTGGGSLQGGFEDVYDVRVGPYDSESFVYFDLSSLAEVPEPATWGLMMIGLGLAGASLRNRRRLTRPRFSL